MLEIKTERPGLVLRQFRPEDSGPLFALIDCNRPHLSQRGDDTAAKYPDYASVLRSITHPKNPKKLRFGIWDGGTLVGMVGLTPRGKGACETGGWTGSEFCNKGYASTTRTVLARFALIRLGFRRVVAKTHPNNEPSQAMLRKAGYRLVRRTEKAHHFAFVRH